jgi:hypothetical protein
MCDGVKNLIQNRSVRKLSVLSAANSGGWISWVVITLEDNVITFPSCVSFFVFIFVTPCSYVWFVGNVYLTVLF